MEKNENLLIGSYIRVWEELFEPYFHFESTNHLFQDADLLNENVICSLSSFESVVINSIPTLKDINSLRGPELNFLILENLNAISSNLVGIFWHYIARKHNLYHRPLSVKLKEGALVLVDPKDAKYEEL